MKSETTETPASPKRTFATLAEAIDFIAVCLEKNDPQALYAEFSLASRKGKIRDYEQFIRASFLNTAFPDLQKRHSQTNIRALYREREFPAAEDTLHLGGHFAELGCIHINFARASRGWTLDEILMCR
jgi:hypothetical protein